MCKDVLITGVPVTQQMKKAEEILKNNVIPREKKFQEKCEGDGTNRTPAVNPQSAPFTLIVSNY